MASTDDSTPLQTDIEMSVTVEDSHQDEEETETELKSFDFETLSLPTDDTLRKDMLQWTKLRLLRVYPITIQQVLELQQHIARATYCNMKFGSVHKASSPIKGMLLLFFPHPKDAAAALTKLKEDVKEGIKVDMMNDDKDFLLPQDEESIRWANLASRIQDHESIVYVGNLPKTANEEALSEFFPNAIIRVPSDHQDTVTGYGYVFYESEQKAKEAVKRVQYKQIILDHHLLAIEQLSKLTCDLTPAQVASLQKRKAVVEAALSVIEDKTKDVAIELKKKLKIVNGKLQRHFHLKKMKSANAASPNKVPNAGTNKESTSKGVVPAVGVTSNSSASQGSSEPRTKPNAPAFKEGSQKTSNGSKDLEPEEPTPKGSTCQSSTVKGLTRKQQKKQRSINTGSSISPAAVSPYTQNSQGNVSTGARPVNTTQDVRGNIAAIQSSKDTQPPISKGTALLAKILEKSKARAASKQATQKQVQLYEESPRTVLLSDDTMAETSAFQQPTGHSSGSGSSSKHERDNPPKRASVDSMSESGVYKRMCAGENSLAMLGVRSTDQQQQTNAMKVLAGLNQVLSAHQNADRFPQQH